MPGGRPPKGSELVEGLEGSGDAKARLKVAIETLMGSKTIKGGVRGARGEGGDAARASHASAPGCTRSPRAQGDGASAEGSVGGSALDRGSQRGERGARAEC